MKSERVIPRSASSRSSKDSNSLRRTRRRETFTKNCANGFFIANTFGKGRWRSVFGAATGTSPNKNQSQSYLVQRSQIGFTKILTIKIVTQQRFNLFARINMKTINHFIDLILDIAYKISPNTVGYSMRMPKYSQYVGPLAHIPQTIHSQFRHAIFASPIKCNIFLITAVVLRSKAQANHE